MNDAAAPVEVKNAEPIAVSVQPGEPTSRQSDEMDRVTHGQRRINLIWELTQAAVAISVTLTTLVTAASLTLRGDTGSAAFLLLSNAFFLVIGFYFGRTNHQRVGGVGGGDAVGGR